MKGYFRRYGHDIILIIILVILAFVLISHNIINIQSLNDKGDHFNTLTINSILAGFLFTGLGIMISGMDKEKIVHLENGGYLDRYYFTIYVAISFNIISIISSIFIIFNLANKIQNILLYIEQIATLFGIVFFIKSMNNLRKIINKMRNKN